MFSSKRGDEKQIMYVYMFILIIFPQPSWAERFVGSTASRPDIKNYSSLRICILFFLKQILFFFIIHFYQNAV